MTSSSVPVAPGAPATAPIPADRIVIRPGDPTEPHYPQADTHTWGEFAGLAIEMGGYGDITAVNPHTGDRLCLLGAFDGDGSYTDAIRRLMDAIDQHPDFLDPTDKPA